MTNRFEQFRRLARVRHGRTGRRHASPIYEPGRKLFIAAHKICPLPCGEGYEPIHAGKAGSASELGFAGDDTGNHISHWNAFFCELTVLYWIWRNVNCEHVGLMHYRRYFAGVNRFDCVADTSIAAGDDFSELDGSHDIVLPHPLRITFPDTKIAMSIERHYVEYHHGYDLLSVRQALVLLHSDYVEAFDFVMRNNAMSTCNMFVGKKQWVDRYCAWLFPILFHVAKRSRYASYDGDHRRVFGYLAERLFNVWIARHWNELRIAYRSCVVIGT